jgi:hypothetical protein
VRGSEVEPYTGLAKRGFGIAGGLGFVSGSGSGEGASFTYSGHGQAVELSYQGGLPGNNTVAIFLNALNAGPSYTLGVDFRHWFGRGFLGGRVGFEQSNIPVTVSSTVDTGFSSATVSQDETIRAGGLMFGVVGGYQWDNGLELYGSITDGLLTGSLDDSSGNSTSFSINETRTLLLIGYRF